VAIVNIELCDHVIIHNAICFSGIVRLSFLGCII